MQVLDMLYFMLLIITYLFTFNGGFMENKIREAENALDYWENNNVTVDDDSVRIQVEDLQKDLDDFLEKMDDYLGQFYSTCKIEVKFQMKLLRKTSKHFYHVHHEWKKP